MSHDNVRNTWDFVKGAFPAVGLTAAAWDAATKRPDPLAPPQTASSTAPTIQEANTEQAKNTLAAETSRARASTLLTGGQGLLDEPTTASQTLLGS